MIYSRIETRYITSGINTRLVRYDAIYVDDDTIVVKVFDDQQRGISPPNSIIEVATLNFTKEEYKSEQGIGGLQRSVQSRMPPSFEDHVWDKCQEHRNSLTD
ncbi:TPA: hypothetical protein L7569_004629 [Klebsiella pneumoniae]|nr:hypothetical protein [Klebsiella pneumoniae]HBT5612303.1 hypothetical protein [Klebsiella pneumoniae]